MTATPEERAEGLVDQLYDELEYVSSEQAKWMTDLIAQAIREAEDAAIERAIACVSDNFVNGEGHYAIEAILALKHNKG